MKAAAAIATAIEQARDDLDQLRDRIADLRADREVVASAPVDRDTAEARIIRLVESARASGVFDQPGLFASDAQPVSPYLNRILAENMFAVMRRWRRAS